MGNTNTRQVCLLCPARIAMDPTSRLPLELVQKIFRHYLYDREIPVQSFDHSDGLWVLGQVNRAWRDATFSDPSLWSSINASFAYGDPRRIENIDGTRGVTLNDGVVKSLTYILAHSENVPLSLYLRFFVRSPSDKAFPAWRSFFSLLIAQCRRFRSFDFVVPTEIWDYWTRTSPRFPLLKELNDIFDTDWLVPVMSTRFMRHNMHADDVAPTSRIQMPQLHRLAVHTQFFLDSITAPNLKSLIMTDSPSATTSTHAPPLVHFLHRSKCALTDIDFSWRGTLDELFTVLSSLPMLESLSFRSDFEIAFYERMKLPSSILPMLRAFTHQLYISVECQLWLLGRSGDVTPIIDMVESRLGGGTLESVNISRVIARDFSEDSEVQRRLAAINALSHVKVDIHQLTVGSHFSGGPYLYW